MNSYTVSWLDSHGKKYESTVQATNTTQAERAVWGEEEECLFIVRTIRVD